MSHFTSQGVIGMPDPMASMILGSLAPLVVNRQQQNYLSAFWVFLVTENYTFINP